MSWAESSTFITCIGEMIPQTNSSRHALRMASILTPALRFFQFVLHPVAKPVGADLDGWLGREGLEFYREQELREMIKRHVESDETDYSVKEK
jgi:CBS domain containing-hemolysin-like protein